MTFDLDDVELALTGAIRQLLGDRHDSVQRRGTLGGRHDEDLWKALSQDLGLLPMALPEDVGGDAGGDVLIGLAMREMGRALYDGPYLSSVVLACGLLETVEHPAEGHRVLSRVQTGELRPTAGLPNSYQGTRASRLDDTWLLAGAARAVLDAGTASHLVVVAELPLGGRGIFLVDLTSAGVSVDTLETFDLTRSFGLVHLDGVRADLVGPTADDALTRTADRARIMLASEQVGGAAATLEIAVEHAKTRHQFGRPIGSYQAIKHQCADVLVAIETAAVTVDHALCLLQEGEDVSRIAPMVAAMSSEAYVQAATSSLHVHGGMGFTWEHDAHLHLRRATSSSHLLGSPSTHRELLLERLGL